MDLSRRSDLKELLDRDDIPLADIERNMLELDTINTRLGGHAITVAGFKILLERRDRLQMEEVIHQARAPKHPPHSAPLLVAEIGCGGGDNLLAIRQYCREHNRAVRFIGVDLNPHCIAVASAKFSDTEACWITADYRTVSFEGQRPDILFSSLFCHHFGEGELAGMLRWMQAQSATGFFINDLHRHALAYHSIKLLVSLFSRSYLVKNDAPLSVLRGFRRAEWEQILLRAGIKEYILEWKWAFRWLLVVSNR
jgi:SAM-dependent methyltransferase